MKYRKLKREFYDIVGRWRILNRKGLVEQGLPTYAVTNMARFVRRHNRLQEMDEEGLFLSTNIETFGPCNRECSFCFNHDRFADRRLGVMDESIWRKLMDEFSTLNFAGRISPYFYGEPLLDKRLARLISYAREKCPLSYIQIHSNGDYLTESMLQELIVAGVDRFVITNYDDDDKPHLDLLQDKYPYWVRHRHYTDFEISNRAGGMFDRANERKMSPCFRPSSQLVIDWNGKVGLCCNDYYTNNSIGNVHDSGVYEIWHNETFQKFRAILEQPGGRQELEFCRNCDMDGSTKIK